MNSTAEIMDAGMNCLVEKLGTVGAERFVSTIIREQNDYTAWRQKYFKGMTRQDYRMALKEYEQENHDEM